MDPTTQSHSNHVDATDNSDDSEDGLTYVFCTADIPASTLNAFLTRLTNRNSSLEHLEMPHSGVLIVQTPEVPHTATRASRAPLAAFRSPFLGQTQEQMTAFFKTHVQQHDPTGISVHSVSTFIILDERSVSEELCLIVSEAAEPASARCEFDLAVEVLVAPEMGTGELNEGLRREEWTEGGEWVYRLEKWKRYMEEE
ncbi:hypothetical protein MMC11_004366 [Xylographa trunciseda]|nr:hypothetical protein [Xylographa trunciseda]